jgi:hypothetical protein
MKSWHIILPLAAMAAMEFAFDKSEQDPAIASPGATPEALGRGGPSMPRGPSRPSDGPRPRTSLTGAAMRDRYQRAFEAEARDGGWADSAEQAAGDRLKALTPHGSSVRSVECRASMCRIQTAHVDHPTYERFVRGVFIGPQAGIWCAPQLTTLEGPPTERGTLEAVSYLAREGGSLPALD